MPEVTEEVTEEVTKEATESEPIEPGLQMRSAAYPGAFPPLECRNPRCTIEIIEI